MEKLQKKEKLVARKKKSSKCEVDEFIAAIDEEEARLDEAEAKKKFVHESHEYYAQRLLAADCLIDALRPMIASRVDLSEQLRRYDLAK